jgi:hypothetical protein
MYQARSLQIGLLSVPNTRVGVTMEEMEPGDMS